MDSLGHGFSGHGSAGPNAARAIAQASAGEKNAALYAMADCIDGARPFSRPPMPRTWPLGRLGVSMPPCLIVFVWMTPLSIV